MVIINYNMWLNCGYFWTVSANFSLISVYQPTPIFLLPKLEYQAYYGVEALTESEVCQLWTQSMLHSKCLFYIGKFMSGVFA